MPTEKEGKPLICVLFLVGVKKKTNQTWGLGFERFWVFQKLLPCKHPDYTILIKYLFKILMAVVFLCCLRVQLSLL